jgi:capsular polysaccharide biosynthesis protein
MYFENLVVVRGLTVHGTYMSPFSVMSANAMARRAIEASADVPTLGHDKLFVKRVPGWRRGRDLHNEEEVARRLSNRGFWPVEPGTLSLDHQIVLFSRAKHVIGVIGAAMTNIAFCQPGTRITMLVPCAFPDTFFWFIAQHRQLDYLEVRCDQVSYEPPDSWVAGFTLREKDIRYLEES